MGDFFGELRILSSILNQFYNNNRGELGEKFGHLVSDSYPGSYQWGIKDYQGDGHG